MPSCLSPGVYVEEVTSGSRPIEGVGTLVAAFVKDGDKPVETFDVSAKKGNRPYVVTQVKERSKLITVTVTEAAPSAQLVRPENQTLTLPAPPAAAPAVPAESAHPGPAEYLGDSADRTGFGGLEAIDEISMVAVPDLMAAYERGAIDLDAVKAVQLGLIAHCELVGDRVAIIDPPPSQNARPNRVWRQDTAGYDSKYADLCYPWIKFFEPATGGQPARHRVEGGVHRGIQAVRTRSQEARPQQPPQAREFGPQGHRGNGLVLVQLVQRLVPADALRVAGQGDQDLAVAPAQPDFPSARDQQRLVPLPSAASCTDCPAGGGERSARWVSAARATACTNARLCGWAGRFPP